LILKSLQLKRFRNFIDESLHIKNKLVIIVGENGQGKTNLLESIHFTSSGKSWRTKNHSELIKINEEDTYICAEFIKDNLKKKIEILINSNAEKTIRFNGKHLSSYHSLNNEFFGEINVVNFSPEDINIINGAPGERRIFINFILSQVSRLYREHLSSYNRIVSQRNRALFKNNKTELEIWTEKLIEEGIYITEKRLSGLSKFSEFVKEYYSLLQQGNNKGNYELLVIYKSSVGFIKELNDLSFDGTLLSKKAYRDKFSRGEQRLLALALKLAQYKLIEKTLGETPIVLIDDVLSELDEHRREEFLKHLNDNAQIFIAGTDEKIFNIFDSDNVDKVKVVNGKIF